MSAGVSRRYHAGVMLVSPEYHPYINREVNPANCSRREAQLCCCLLVLLQQRAAAAMAGAKEQQDCLFCNLCGSLLDFDSASFASCLLCHNQRSVQDFQGKEIWYTSTPQDFMRRLGVDLLIQPEEEDPTTAEDTDQIQQRAVVNDECPKCKNRGLEYYTKQLRSADEGQTVFYECPKCHHKFSQNM